MRAQDQPGRIAASIRDSVEHAVEMGIPLGSVVGADRFLEDGLTEFAEVRSIVLLSAQGEVIARVDVATGDGAGMLSRVSNAGVKTGPGFAVPVLCRNTLVGEVRIEIEPGYLRGLLQEVLLDIFGVGLVSILLVFELVIAVLACSPGKPLDRIFTLMRMQARGDFSHVIPRSDGGNLRRIVRRVSDRATDPTERAPSRGRLERLPQTVFGDVRLPLFLFSTATEISGAVLPLCARDAGGPAWMTGEILRQPCRSSPISAPSPWCRPLAGCGLTALQSGAGLWQKVAAVAVFGFGYAMCRRSGGAREEV